MTFLAKIIVCLMLVFPVISIDAQAMSSTCKKISLKDEIEQADVVFEGRKLNMDFYRVEDENHSRFNFNQTSYYFPTFTYIVDKNWKGTSFSQQIVYLPPTMGPLTNRNDVAEVKRMYSQSGKEEFGKKVVLTFQKQNGGAFEGLYRTVECGSGEHEITAENLKVLHQKFPSVSR